MEAGERNAIEGKFGEDKQRYGLDRVLTRLSTGRKSMIHSIFMDMNIKERLRDLV